MNQESLAMTSMSRSSGVNGSIVADAVYVGGVPGGLPRF